MMSDLSDLTLNHNPKANPDLSEVALDDALIVVLARHKVPQAERLLVEQHLLHPALQGLRCDDGWKLGGKAYVSCVCV